MKKFVLVCLFVASSFAAQTGPLGVLYDTNNIISPDGLKITNLTIIGATASKVTAFSAASKLVNTLLDSSKADILQSWVAGASTLNLGQAQIIAGEGSPTNGTAYLTRILYINSTGTNLNDTYWGNYGTNWYAIASTNGGSIIETQFNFSDNTTANATTNRHGLLRKLSGNFTEYLSGDGVWRDPLSGLGSLTTGRVPVYSGLALANSDITTSILPAGDYGLISTKSWNVHNLRVTNTATIGTATVTNFGGTTTGDVSTSAHGLVPTAPNDSSKFLNGLGTWSVPAGGSGTNGLATTGSPSATQLAYFTGTNSVSGVPSSSVSVAGVSVPTLTTTTSLNINPDDTVGNIKSGSYKPTPSVMINCDLIGVSNTFNDFFYNQIGNIVFVQGTIQIHATSGGTLRFDVDYPPGLTPATQKLGFGVAGQGIVMNGTSDTFIGNVVIFPETTYPPSKIRITALDNSASFGTLRNFVVSFSYNIE